MNKIKQFYNKHISETKRLKDNPIFSILIFFPASFITAILIIPIVIISYPLVYLFKKQELKIFSVNWSFGLSEVIINGLIAFIVFYNSIKEMIHENLNETYGDNWKF